MTQYFFEPQTTESGIRRLFAIVNSRYYWSISWTSVNQNNSAAIQDFQAGFLTEEIKKHCNSLQQIEAADLRNKFGSFSYYIERAVSGFKSYILWINPDPEVSHISWQIPLE